MSFFPPAGESPLLTAAGGDIGVLEYLFGCGGGDRRMTDARGSTPLHDAAERGVFPTDIGSLIRGHYLLCSVGGAPASTRSSYDHNHKNLIHFSCSFGFPNALCWLFFQFS